jgi:hypothetical protein
MPSLRLGIYAFAKAACEFGKKAKNSVTITVLPSIDSRTSPNCTNADVPVFVTRIWTENDIMTSISNGLTEQPSGLLSEGGAIFECTRVTRSHLPKNDSQLHHIKLDAAVASTNGRPQKNDGKVMGQAALYRQFAPDDGLIACSLQQLDNSLLAASEELVRAGSITRPCLSASIRKPTASAAAASKSCIDISASDHPSLAFMLLRSPGLLTTLPLTSFVTAVRGRGGSESRPGRWACSGRFLLPTAAPFIRLWQSSIDVQGTNTLLRIKG